MSTTRIQLDGVVAEHVAAINAFDVDAVVATFAEDALVNDVRREFWGKDAIRRWVAEEIVGDRVTVDPIDVIGHHGQTIVRGRYDGDYDKANLPEELILTSYFTVEEGRIVTLIIIHNTPAGGPLADAPEVVRAYFERDADRDVDAIVALFAEDAVVVDEGETRGGTGEIMAWQTGPASKYTYTTEVLGGGPLEVDRYVVHGRLTGDFPGGTAELSWDFTIRSGRISRLTIAPPDRDQLTGGGLGS
jgi:ketosteroid isomerase-like protein